LTIEVVTVTTPVTDANLKVFREDVRRSRVRLAGQTIMAELVGYAKTNGTLDSSRPYPLLGNRPDWNPFRNTFEESLRVRLAEIETQRIGPGNADAVCKSSLIVRDAWEGTEPTVIIVDSCIARATTFATQFLPCISSLTGSVHTIIYFVILATRPGLERIDESSKRSVERVVVINAAVDPSVDTLGFITRGVGPPDWTKRITEKMGVTPLWQEVGGYPLIAARQALSEKLDGPQGNAQALYVAGLWLVWLMWTNGQSPASFRWLNKATSVVNDYAGVLDSTSSELLGSVLDGLRFCGLVEGPPYHPTEEGVLYLEHVGTKVLEDHPVYGRLAEALENLWPDLKYLGAPRAQTAKRTVISNEIVARGGTFAWKHT
jgi:hypothetical protein